MIYKNLYDLAGLSLIDSDTDSVIFTDTETVESVFLTQNSKKEFAEIFRANLNKKFKTGDIIVVANEDMTVKAYCLITIICGQIVPYVLYYIDMNRGEESIRNFSIADIEMLSAYPILSEPEELIFFLTKLSIVFAENAPTDYRKYIQVIKSYLDKGLWATNITWPADASANSRTKSLMDKMEYRQADNYGILFEKNGQILSFCGTGLYGPYEEVRKVYCEMASIDGYESMVYNDFFGMLFTTEWGNGDIARNLIVYEEDVKKALTPKPIEKTETAIVNEIAIKITQKIEAGEENFLSKMDKMLEVSMVEDDAKSKNKRKDKAVERFSVDAEISTEEMTLAVRETISKIPIKIKVPVLTKGSKLNQVSKEKDAILNSPQDSYPIDWNHIYTVGETSKRYNLTYGQKYDESTDMFYDDPAQKNGMSTEDWNAYFIAHPELSHLIDETIGHLGGVFKTEQDLMETGHLLYDVKKVRLVYRHEYIKGNVYKLIDELESVKEVVINVYKQPFYDIQMEILLNARPEMKKITSADPKKIPFIHPLDETIVVYKINSAAGITYQNNQNKKLMFDEKRRLEDGIKSGIVQAKEVPSMLEEFGARLQSLPITVFFMEWLSEQYGKIAEYGLPDIELVNNLYFYGMSYSSYANALVDRGIIKVPNDKKPTDVVSSSDYFEAKDSAKRFVNDLFQDFLINEVSEFDRDDIDYQWNKRYNGYASPDVWKLPIFIRHSKYFKNRKNKRYLKLSDVQITGIKFATIENSSIMAHEVGYGKAEWVENKIFTPTGTKKMGDLDVGDYVIGANGKPNMVIGTFPQGEKEMFKVSFNDKSNVIVCGEHLWQVQSMRQRSQEKYKKNYYVKTTKEILEAGLTYERKPGHTQNRWAIPMTKPVEFEPQNVFIEPYLLGLLLGDGCLSAKDGIGYSSVDKELVDAVSETIPNGLKLKKKKNNDIDYGISRLSRLGSDQNSPLLIYLRNYGLQGKKSNNKFIPTEYKFNSVEVRLAILQGLLDTDGSAATHQIEYTTISKRLAEDVVFLTQSLGGTAKVKERNTFYTYKGEKKQGQLSYRLDIKLPGDIQPFRLQRKINKYIPKTKYQPSRFITSIEFVGNLEAKCIKVEAQDSLYLTENFIVTHNTLVAIGYMSHCFETRQASNFLVTVPKTLYVNKKWREEVYGLYDEAKDNFIIGATPNYNLIELGNFSTTEIYGGGKSKYKNYSDDDLDKINYLGRIFTEIGGKESGKNTTLRAGTATVPSNPYNYKQAISVSNFAWSKLINNIFPGIDPVLFNRCKGKNAEEYNAILETFTNYNLGTTSKDKATNIVMLVSKIIDLKWYYQKHLTLFDSSVKFSGRVAYDEQTQKVYDKFYDSELPNQFKKDKDGKVLLDKNGNKILKPVTIVSQEYILIVLDELHTWIESICQRMKDFAIYEYGSWTFGTSDRNIILATKEALQNLGFSSKYLEGIKSVIEEITTYKYEENFDSKYASTTTIIDDVTGEKKSYKRNPQKVLQKQLQELVDKINTSMTEEGERGKFFLDNLKIDGFILDEAHIAKKIFTNVKTDASIKLDFADGNAVLIKTTSHDIKGGSAPAISLAVFSVCQYIRALGNRKPLMLLTATPFSNQPTEIFSMLSLVGISQLRDYGISNIKNFFDLFLKETLKYDFNQNGEFIKRITVEDFRNKEMLINLIWSVMDIRRESSLDKLDQEERRFGDKPIRKVFPKLSSDSSMQKLNDSTDDANAETDLESLGNINTIAVLNRMNTNTCSIVDQNDVQRRMMADIEKVVSKQVNPKTQLEYTFDDFCPNAAIFNELESKENDGVKKKKGSKTDEEEERDSVVVTLRTLLNSNVTAISGGVNLKDYQDVQNYYASVDFKNAKLGTLIFVKDGFNNYQPGWQLYKKALKQVKGSPSVEYMQLVTDESTASNTIKTLTKNIDYGTTFKALGISKAIALSPYLYRCNDLPYPTPENIVKYSPKIEYLVKALKMVKDYHINEIPKKIDNFNADLKKLQGLSNPTQADLEQIEMIRKELPQLVSAKEVSGQVIYMNMIRFNYYYIDDKGKSQVQNMNIAELIIQYLIDKGWFSKDDVKLISSNTSDKDKEAYIKGFQDGTIKVLFGTPAIKEGVDLQNKASTMYIMTPDWNPTDMRQVEGRIWRRDNENKYIRIVYVLLDQSIEVFIYSKLEEKSQRLQKIMKERGTIAELEEMSLNPNETKVALASDPVKRADIITKLSGAILEDQKNKINKNREELLRVSNTIEKVYENIEIIKSNYLIPYLEEAPAINIRYYDFLLKQIVELYMTNKKAFLNRFADNSYGVSNFSSLTILPPDPIFKAAIAQLHFGASMETLTYGIWNTEANEMYDLLNGLEICIDNKDEFVQAINNGANSLALITQKSPLRFAPNSQRVDGYLFCDKPGGNDDLYRLFTAGAVLYRMTDEQTDELKSILNSINSKRGVSMVSRQEIRNMMEGFVVFAVEKYNEYAMNHPSLRPENYGQYIYYRDLRDRQKVSIVVDTFDALELNDKIKEIRVLFDNIQSQLGNWVSLGVQTQRDIMDGKNKIPYQSEILVKLGIAFNTQAKSNEIRLMLDETFRPVLRIESTLKEIQKTMFEAKGLSMSDLPNLLISYQTDYDNINNKLDALELSRVKLIERFEKMNDERKNVSIDQIVAKFALTNNYLNYKLQD